MSFGFIILRHVNSQSTDRYWKLSYDCIRKFYPENEIVIIDDNSKQQFITNKKLYKTHIIKSEFPGRGELLPYYYYSKNLFFDTAVIIHDSVFINKKIDFNVETYKLMWCFEIKDPYQIKDERRLINIFNDENLKQFHKNKKWHGCYGGMSIVKYEYLNNLNKKYDFSKLLPLIKNRHNRMSFERVIACILQIENREKIEKRQTLIPLGKPIKFGSQLSGGRVVPLVFPSARTKPYDMPKEECLLGNIFKYCPWGMGFAFGIKYGRKKNLPVTKIWSGR